MSDFPITDIQVSAYSIPTDGPESDGTLDWQETTMVLVRITAGDKEGLGYTYAHVSAAAIVASVLAPLLKGKDAMDIPALHASITGRIRNNGQCGLAMMAVSAADTALWDLKAKLAGLPLCRLLGRRQEGMLIYGSGGFTNYTHKQLREQLGGWAGEGLTAVKMKVGRDPAADAARVAVARDTIGEQVELYVDANGAYTPYEASTQARLFSGHGVTWLEEPMPAQYLRQLAGLRRRLDFPMRIVAGEYGYTLDDFHALLEAGAVDVLQADATRCGGITGFLKAGHLCEAFRIPLSSHCAPSIHLHAALALSCFSIGEYFHDHVRIERQFFEGISLPRDGRLFPDTRLPGLGIAFRQQDAERYRVA